jgi:hypothetical protein
VKIAHVSLVDEDVPADAHRSGHIFGVGSYVHTDLIQGKHLNLVMADLVGPKVRKFSRWNEIWFGVTIAMLVLSSAHDL